MKAKSIKGKSTEEIKAALTDSMADGFNPTLAIVFLSVKQDIKAVSDLLDKEGIEIFGATTAGEFIDGEIGNGSIAIMLLNIDRSYFKIVFKETGETTTREIAKHIGETGLKTFSRPAYIVASAGLSTDGEMIIKGMEDAAGSAADIFGGKAGDDHKAINTFVFNEKNSTTNGIIALVIDKEKVKISGIIRHGWKPIGTIRTITKSEGSTVYTIDDEPALDLVMKYMGNILDPAVPEDVVYNLDAIGPIQLLRDNASSIMRDTSYINKKDRSIIFAGSVPQGSKIRFSLPPDLEIIDDIAKECKRVKNEQQPETDAMIMFSCAGRKLSFGPMVSEEIQQVKNVWNSPMAGFFCYGEIGRSDDGKNEFHNLTCCLVVLKEK